MDIRNDIDLARKEGVCLENNLPFLLEPENPSGAAVLLVHGFTGSPFEMRPLGDVLTEKGFKTLGIRLPGHGTTPADLTDRHYEEWLEAVEKGYKLLAGKHERIYGIGLSTGALLLLELSIRHQLKGMVLLSPFLRLRHRLAPAAGILRFFKKYQHRTATQEMSPYYYDRRPINGVYQINRLRRRVRKNLNRITTPVLALNAAGDQTILVDSAMELYRKLGSPQKQFHLFGHDVPHGLTTPHNPRLQEVLTLTCNFLEHLDTERKQIP